MESDETLKQKERHMDSKACSVYFTAVNQQTGSPAELQIE